jgi:cytochrome P450
MQVMAGAVICRVIGLGDVPETRARELFEEGERVVSMVSLRSRRLSQRQVAVARHVLDRIGDIAETAYHLSDAAPSLMGRMRSLGLSVAEARGAAGAFFLTGTETVASFVPRFIALLHDRAAGGIETGDLGALDHAIDEAMRVITPSPIMLRSVAEPARAGRVAVRPGDRVLIVTHNCARSLGPFDPSRDHPPELRHLWFGAGPHFCIGFPLAMAEIRAIARVLLDHNVRVVRRSYARRVLIPTYQQLWITSA